jgi:hypothetical protein
LNFELRLMRELYNVNKGEWRANKHA